MSEVYLTWRGLADYITKMPEGHKDDPVQVLPSRSMIGGDAYELHGAYDINTVGYYCSTDEGEEVDTTRSVIDNRHHSDHYVLNVDDNPFDEEGNLYFTLQDDGALVGNVTGKPPKDD